MQERYGILNSVISMTVKEWEQQLECEQFTKIWVAEDHAGFVYAEHSHPVDTVHVVLKGSLMSRTDGQVVEMKAGDRWDVPKNTLHGSTIGPQGCTYLTGIRV